VKLAEDNVLRVPLKNGQPEGTLRNENVASNRLKRSRDPIVFEFVVSAEDPFLTTVLHCDLR
jgi:hypothetical protein